MVSHDRLPRRNAAQIVDMPAFKLFSQDRVREIPGGQFLDDPVPRMRKQLGEGLEMVSQDRLPRRNAAQIVDMPAFKLFSQDRVREILGGQFLDDPVPRMRKQLVEGLEMVSQDRLP